MAKTPPKAAGLDTLSVPERLLLFCVASGTKPARAGITHRTIELSIIKGLIKRERTQGNESRLTQLCLQRAESLQQVLRVPGGELAAALD